jgi:hypothetical protein
MELGRCVRLLAPLAVITVVTAASPLAPPGVGGTGGVRAPAGTCGSPGAAAAAGAAAGATAWYRLSSVVDSAGTLSGMRLEAGAVPGPRYAVDLPAESFASGPERGQILVGDDDGSRSRIRLLDAARGCWTAVGIEGAVVRSAVMDAAAAVIWEHRVDRSTRADLGVWRRGLASGTSERVLEPMAADAAYGRTFTTELATAGGRLVATSCGMRACRSRVLDAVSGQVALVPDTGPVVGLAGGSLAAMSVCDALPCGVDAIDVQTGVRTRVADAVTAVGLGGSTLVWTDAAGGVWQRDLAGAHEPAIRADAALGLSPIRRSSLATSGSGSSGIPLLAPGGRIGDPGSVRVLDPATHRLVRPVEVLP